MVGILASGEAAQGSIPRVLEIFSEKKIVDVVVVFEVNQQRCLEESGQRLDKMVIKPI